MKRLSLALGAAELRSAGKIGGDFYDFVHVSPTVLVVLAADVSGKEIPAAMALGSLRSAFRAIAHRTSDPAQIAAQLSAGLYDGWHASLYVTCLVATFDLGQRTITCTNAGHSPAIVNGCGDLTLQLHAGDVCLIVTDGVTEALDDDSLAGHAPSDATDWDDDRTVVVTTIGAPDSHGQLYRGSTYAQH
jgi:serine phosphatase RsbU (regulator of sigma subunit)